MIINTRVVCLHIINERSGFQNKIWKPFFYPRNTGGSKERKNMKKRKSVADEIQNLFADFDEDFEFEFNLNHEKNEKKESAKQTESSNESHKTEPEASKEGLIVQGTKTFNKPLFMKNIKALMTKTGVKIGQIEHEAQVSPGYLSRISKEGNTSDPSLEFAITAADLLDVSVDYLLNGDAEAMTETDNYLAKFFTKVLNDTISDRILWDREENEENRVISYEFPEDVKGLGVLYNTKQEEDGVRVYYESGYGSRVHLSRDNDSFSVSIPGTEVVCDGLHLSRKGRDIL